MSKIEKVIKAKNMIFDNSLELEVRYDNVNFDEENPYDHQYQGIDTIFLTSFLKRDECFNLLVNQIKKVKVMAIIDKQLGQAIDLEDDADD